MSSVGTIPLIDYGGTDFRWNKKAVTRGRICDVELTKPQAEYELDRRSISQFECVCDTSDESTRERLSVNSVCAPERRKSRWRVPLARTGIPVDLQLGGHAPLGILEGGILPT
jgi:hypothetical protein